MVTKITYNKVCIIFYQGHEDVRTYSSRRRPRPRFLSLILSRPRCKVSRLHHRLVVCEMSWITTKQLPFPSQY